MAQQFFSSFFLLILLTACGGEDSQSNNTSVPKENQFTLTATLKNQCQQESVFSHYEVHLQSNDWQFLEKYVPDSNGQVTITTTQDNINYTIIAKHQQDTEHEGLDIVSYFQADSSGSAHYYARYDTLQNNEQCQCISQDINLQHRTFSEIAAVSTSFNYREWQATTPQSTYFSDATICRQQHESWPINSISIRGLDTNNNIVGVASLLTGFDSNENNLWQSSAVEVAETIYLPEDHENFELTQFFANGRHFKTNVTETDEQIAVFNSHAYTSESMYQSSSKHVFEDIDTLFGRSTFSSYHQIRSTTYDEAFAVAANEDKPSIDNSHFSELSSDGHYDYSAISGYPMVKITFDYELNSPETNQPMPTKWTMYGPIKGQLASSVQLNGLAQSISPDSKITSTEIQIIKSMSFKNYQDYIQNYQNITHSDFSDDLSYFHLQLTL